VDLLPRSVKRPAQRLRDAIDERAGFSRSRGPSATGRKPLVAAASDNAGSAGEKRPYDVFVSYNRAETPPVERIARRLRNEGIEPFFDRWAMTPGRPWQDDILNAMSGVAACAVFIGHEGLGDWAREELAVAQSRAAKDPRFRLFMVLLPGAPSPLDPRLAFLSTRSWVDLRPDGGHGSSFEDLLAAITGVPRHAQPASIDGASSPYRGLEAFDERHAGMFFGREDDTRRLCEQLSDSRFVAVLGPSGSGKSSVVKAGLIPSLRRNSLAHSAEWTIRTMTPGGRPLAGLAALLADGAAGESMQRTLDALAADERTVDLAVALALAGRPTAEQFVLVVDQLEEVFTLCRDEDERAAFLSNLIYAATIPGGRTIVVVTLRADFYDRCAPYPSVRSVLALQHMLIGPLSEDGLRRAIEEPAWAVGLTLEPGLVDTILADVGDRPGSLPLLQHVLLQVWQRRRRRLLTLEAYVESGGVQGALAKHADAVYERLSEAQRDVTERVLLRLVQPGEGTEDARRRVDLDELLTAGDEPAGVEAVLRTLADERLLTTSRDETSGARLVEITHEALLQGWPRLRRWIERDREALLAHRRLTEASREWERSGRDQGFLYRGTRLAAWRAPSQKVARSRRRAPTDAVEWRTLRNQSLNQLEREFLEASLDRARRDRQFRRWRLAFAFGVLAVSLVAVGIIALVALDQRRNAVNARNVAVSRQLASQSRDALQDDPELALRLALWAVDTRRTERAKAALRQATLAFHQVGAVPADSLAVRAVSYSPDGSRLVTGGDRGIARLWDSRTRRELARLPGGHGAVLAVRYTPTGQRIVMAYGDGTLLVTSPSLRAPQELLRAQGKAINGVAVSADGRQVAAALEDGTVRLLPFDHDGPARTFTGHRGPVLGVDINADGTLAASAGDDGTVRLWNTADGTGRVIHSGGRVQSDVAFSPDGETLIGVGHDGRLRLFNGRTGALERQMQGGDRELLAAAFSSDGRRFAVGGADGVTRVWSTAGGPPVAVLRGQRAQVFDVDFGPSGEDVASGGDDGTARMWDAGQAQSWIAGPVTYSIDFSASGRYVAGASDDGAVRIFDAASGDLRRTLQGPRGYTNAEFSPTADEVLVVRDSESSVVRWPITRKRADSVVRLEPGRGMNAARFDGAGRRIVYAAPKGAIAVRDAGSSSEIAIGGAPGNVLDVRISPDGKRVAGITQNGKLVVWRLDRPARPERVFDGHRGHINALAYARDGRIATGGADRTVRIWNDRTGSHVLLRGHTDEVTTVVFTNDGSRVLSTSSDGTLRLWDARGGEALAVLQFREDDELYDVDLSRDGRIATLGKGDVVRVFRCDVCGSFGQVLALARSRTPRQLSPEDRRRFLAGAG
jgi:WD40 repeat protein